ncbi:hypothetical protein Hamer_G022374 [Homarus americanus]|uniref:Uncharacterized protein n=1 Tax=Homarus americanus TaxID=6706 RepID=A0A8J5JED0_HOMAM|nr:hypothetical protein Hamer_G022374 [Homarus americanus]
MQVFVLVVAAAVLAARVTAAPQTVLPVVDSPETHLFKSLTPVERQVMVQMALSQSSTPNARMMVDKPSTFPHGDNKLVTLATALRLWLRASWQLTPEQMKEILETGKLCNDDGKCIDFNVDWSHNCCPFG